MTNKNMIRIEGGLEFFFTFESTEYRFRLKKGDEVYAHKGGRWSKDTIEAITPDLVPMNTIVFLKNNTGLFNLVIRFPTGSPELGLRRLSAKGGNVDCYLQSSEYGAKRYQEFKEGQSNYDLLINFRKEVDALSAVFFQVSVDDLSQLRKIKGRVKRLRESINKAKGELK